MNHSPYQLSFHHASGRSTTRHRTTAWSLKQAIKDAHYWADWGAGRVCIRRRADDKIVGCAVKGKSRLVRP